MPFVKSYCSQPAVIDELKKYKKRNLESSHTSRIWLNAVGSSKCLNRRHFIMSNSHPDLHPTAIHLHSSPSLEFYKPLPAEKLKTCIFNSSVNNCGYTNEKDESCETWIDRRMKFRNDLNKFDFDISWLKRKPDRTPLENQVLHSMKDTNHASNNNHKVSYLILYFNVILFIDL